MTNFRPVSSADWLTRERFLVGAPVVLSGLIMAGLAMIVVGPTMVRIDAKQKDVIVFQAKQERLPNLRAELQQAQLEQQTWRDQQEMLLDLIAGRDRIATFLALLEQEALVSGVRIVRYEPVAVAAAPVDSRRSSRAQSAAASPTAAPNNVMTDLGYRQTAVSLGVEGGFEALQDFLQRMESLEVVVEASDLSLRSLSLEAPSAQSLTELALRLSFLDRSVESSAEQAPSDPV